VTAFKSGLPFFNLVLRRKVLQLLLSFSPSPNLCHFFAFTGPLPSYGSLLLTRSITLSLTGYAFSSMDK
jgi:hypothetical protein